MAEIDNNALATIEFVLKWNDTDSFHEDSFLARRVNVWRDIFPNGLLSELKGSGNGDVIKVEFQPGEMVPAYSKSLVREIPLKKFIPVSSAT